MYLSTVFYSLQDTSPLRWFGNLYRFHGAVPWLAVLWLSVLAHIRPTFFTIHKATGIVGLMLFVGTSPWFGVNGSQRSIGPFGEPNALAGFALLLFVLTYHHLRGPGKLFQLVLLSIVLLLTQSASGLVATGVYLAFVYLPQSLPTIWKLSFCLCLGLLPMIYVVNEPLSSTDRRVDIWRISLVTAEHKPLLGYGFGGVETGLKDTIANRFPDYQRFYVDDPHNIALLHLLAGGLLGLVAFVLVVLSALTNSLRSHTSGTASLLALLMAAWYNPQSIMLYAGLWILIGLALRTPGKKTI